MATPIRDIHQQGQLARKRKRAFLTRSGYFLLAMVLVMAGVGYLFFFSPAFTIRNISVSGLPAELQSQATANIQTLLNEPQLSYLKPNKNILFLNVEDLRSQLLDKMPGMKEISVSKSYFHSLAVSFEPRELAAIWCFAPDDCWYVDQNGEKMTQAPETSGFVFIQINDVRERERTVDQKFFGSILNAVKKMSDIRLNAKSVSIPHDSFSEFRVQTIYGYDVIFDLDSDLSHQLEVLRVFWEEKKKDPLFAPQYVDLRIDGRVYYR
ncbi:MAG: hypothetical protein KW806_01570 [Candidatus Yanofskybacteria bacterium]|nr:hypothetical protein [Candidatus Yanofskybacteria bacterium]